MTTRSAEVDRAPIPPTPPTDGECCGRGCEHCVWVYYHEARRKYEEAYAEWESSVGRG
jgi:hypothetical protein